MAFDPLSYSFSFMNTVVIHDHIDAGNPGSGIRVIQECQQVTEEGIGFPRAPAMQYLASGEIEGPAR